MTAEQKLARAKVLLAMAQPFVSLPLMRIPTRFVPKTVIMTIGIKKGEKTWELLCNRNFVKYCKVAELARCLYHEVIHCVYVASKQHTMVWFSDLQITTA